MNADIKKKIIKYSIIIGSAIIFFSAGFGVGYGTKFRRAESNSNGVEQRIDGIGDAANSAGNNISTGISTIGSAVDFTNIAIGSIDGATVINTELQSKLDEIARVTKAYQESIQLANSTINDIFDLSIRRAELDEEFINQIVGLLESSGQSPTK